jgi:hypothetical protein
MLSRDCDGCEQLHKCKIRFIQVEKNEFVYCPNGDRHLVDTKNGWIKK